MSASAGSSRASTRHAGCRSASAGGRYAALGPPDAVAETIHRFREAGVRHVIVDSTGPLEEREAQLERFAKEVRPLLGA